MPTTPTTDKLRLSERVRRLTPSATLAVSGRVKELQAQGVDVIGFGVGEPDFDTPESIRDVAIASLRAGDTHYGPVPGAPDARKAIAAKLRNENGIECSATDIVISTGAKHSLYLTMQCLLDPGRGQEVIVLTPAWVSYRPIVELAGGTVVEVAASTANDFKVTPAQLESAITDRTAAVIVNSPSNPCGTMYSPDELRALGAVLAAHPGVVVVTDEIYEKIIFGDDEHFSLGSLPALAERTVTINGMSKAFAMTGWRIGYLCAPGDGGAIAKAAARLQGQMTSCITSFCSPAIAEALTNAAADVERMRRVFARRAEIIYGIVSGWPEIACPRPTGAFYLFPDVSAHFGKTSPGGAVVTSAVSLAEALLEEAQVAVVPGDDFGECARGHIRLSFACDEDAIREGCGRIGDWLGKLGR